jgi:hypothetical protein
MFVDYSWLEGEGKRSLGNGEKGVSFIIFGLSTCDGTDFYFILLLVKLANNIRRT